MEKRRLLLLACSQQKRSDPGLLPAIQRYDGPAFKVMRKYAQTYPDQAPDVFVLSAQFGLIQGDALIPAYDRRMTSARARELQEQVAANVRVLEIGRRYRAVFLSGGSTYRQALAQSDWPSTRFTLATGSQGVRLSQLKAWLHENPMTLATTRGTELTYVSPVAFHLRGKRYEVSPSEAIAVAREGMRNGVKGAVKIGAWSVLIDRHAVSPKWLVSQITGVPVGRFHSDDARRVLGQLGMSVRQA